MSANIADSYVYLHYKLFTMTKSKITPYKAPKSAVPAEKTPEQIRSQIKALSNQIETGRCKNPFAVRNKIDQLEKSIKFVSLIEMLAR